MTTISAFKRHKMIIAIDGYSATGKSTLAKLLSQKTGFRHLNSGLIFRAISLHLLSNHITPNNFKQKLPEINLLTKQFHIDLQQFEENLPNLKTVAVNELGAQVAKLTLVRQRVTEVLKEAVKNDNYIIDGRDIGTTLFPDAEIKFFFKADSTIRAIRLGRERNSNDIKAMKNEIEMRDREDETRELSPLKQAKDAVEIDTSYITVDETLELLMKNLSGLKL